MRATELTRDQQLDAAKTMEKYGGGFAYALAQAFFHADGDNKERILNAFDDLFLRYHRWNEEYTKEKSK